MAKPKQDGVRYGRYEVVARAGRRNYYARYYDREKKYSHYVPTGCSDFQDACAKVAQWAAEETLKESQVPQGGPRQPHEMEVDEALLRYWHEHIQHKSPNQANNIRYKLAVIQAYWAGETINNVVKASVNDWIRKVMAERGISYNTAIDYTTSMRAAFQNEVANNRLAWFPSFATTKKDIRRTQMLTPAQMAQYFDVAAQAPHFFRAVLLCATTACRAGPCYDLQPARQIQWADKDPELRRSLLNLNPPGREQTGKHRPVVPICATLEPWLRAYTGTYWCEYRGKPVVTFSGTRNLPRDAGIITGDPFYVIRHTVARAMKRRKVPFDEREGMLGHIIPGEGEIYAPWDPENVDAAPAAIDDWLAEVNAHCKVVDLRDPTTLDRAAERTRNEQKRRSVEVRWGAKVKANENASRTNEYTSSTISEKSSTKTGT